MNPDHHMSELIGEKNRQPETVNICYVSNILTVGSEPVISFFNEGKSIYRVCLFCISVRNKIYVMEMEMLEPVVLTR